MKPRTLRSDIRVPVVTRRGRDARPELLRLLAGRSSEMVEVSRKGRPRPKLAPALLPSANPAPSRPLAAEISNLFARSPLRCPKALYDVRT